jgi:hypothetical protein
MNAPIKKKHKNNKFKEYINNNKIIIYKNLIINNLKKRKKKVKKKSKSNKNVIQKTNSTLKINSFPKTSSKLVSSLSPEKSSKFINKLNKNSTPFLMINNSIKSNKNNVLHKYNDIELNGLTYEKAIIYDKRSYCQYYCALLQQKHLILFTFVSKVDYNLFTIKLSLFLFSFSLYFALNTLFFDDNTIHKIYETHGKYHLIHSIMNIIYSSLISGVLRFFLKYLALSNKSILDLKHYKNRKKMIKESEKLIQKLNIKFYFYFAISFLFLVFFWYFISAFCAIFKNSQIFFIENSLSSFGLTLIYPFGLYLLPGIFRIKSLKATDKKCMYTLGNIISFI